MTQILTELPYLDIQASGDEVIDAINRLSAALQGKVIAEMTPQPWCIEAGASAPIALSTTPTDIPDATITLPYKGRYLILCAWDPTVTVINTYEGIAYGRLVSAAFGNLTPDVINRIYPDFTATSVLTGGGIGESVATTVGGTITSRKTVSQYYMVETSAEDDVIKMQAFKNNDAFTGVAGDNCLMWATYLGPVV